MSQQHNGRQPPHHGSGGGFRLDEDWFGVLASSPIGIYIVQDGKFRYVNPQSQQISGYPESELIGTRSLDYVHPEDRERVRRSTINALKDAGISHPYEYRLVSKSGEWRWIMESVISVEYLGKPATVGYFMDVTGRKQAEERLRASEENLRNSLDGSPLGIRIADAEGNTLYANQAILDIYGYSSLEELQVTPAAKRHTPESYVGHIERKEKRKRGEPVPDNYEIAIIRKDGKIRHLEVFRKDIKWNGEEQIEVMYHDVTERKQAEEALRNSEERFRQFFMNSPAYCYMISPEGIILDVNNAALEALGYKKEELVGKPRQTLYAPESLLKSEQIFSTWQKTGLVKDEEMVIITKNGDRRIVLLSASAVKSKDGKVLYSVSVQKDITERKQMEEKEREAAALRELDKLRSELLSNVSHELRTPLTSIKGFAGTLLRPDVEWSREEQRSFLLSIDQEADRLARLINDLLDISRIEAGALKLERRLYTISEIVESISRRLGVLAANHVLKPGIPADLPPVYVDRVRIGQVITNLVDNAVKFSPPGSPISIETSREGEQVIVSVIDKGCGIPPQSLGRLFDRFYQAERMVTNGRSGTGLGLSICQGIVRAHGGKIWVESRVGAGSKFSFSLPVSEGKNET